MHAHTPSTTVICPIHPYHSNLLNTLHDMSIPTLKILGVLLQKGRIALNLCNMVCMVRWRGKGIRWLSREGSLFPFRLRLNRFIASWKGRAENWVSFLASFSIFFHSCRTCLRHKLLNRQPKPFIVTRRERRSLVPNYWRSVPKSVKSRYMLMLFMWCM